MTKPSQPISVEFRRYFPLKEHEYIYTNLPEGDCKDTNPELSPLRLSFATTFIVKVADDVFVLIVSGEIFIEINSGESMSDWE